jgi:hypothetical protein
LFDHELTRARRTLAFRQREAEKLYQNDILAAYTDFHRFSAIERERDLKFLRRNM